MIFRRRERTDPSAEPPPTDRVLEMVDETNRVLDELRPLIKRAQDKWGGPSHA